MDSVLNFDLNNYCYGCHACAAICPLNAIQMVSDESGFLYPKISKELCIGCRKCNEVCPHLNAGLHKKNETSVEGSWLYASTDRENKLRSASGGAFYELARKIISDGGYVCGCVWNRDLMAEHIVTNSELELCRMQGSKYVQSNMKNCYQEVLGLLKAEKTVLFSGTPCQVMAMHNIVCKKSRHLRKYLITVSVICHGIAAPGTWSSYKNWLEKQQNSKLVSVNFRDKSLDGYKKSYCRYEFESGQVTYVPTYFPSSKYIEATLVYNLALRKTCGNCECKGIKESSDIILGDWYVEYQGEGALGTSCIAAFTKSGRKIVTENLGNLRVIPFDQIIRSNRFIVDSVVLNKNSDKFLRVLNDSIWDTVEKFYPPKYKIKKLFIQWGIYGWLKENWLN